MQERVPERRQISPFMALFVIVAMQTGMGILSFQQLIAKDAGYDAWLSVIGAGLTVHLLVWMMYKICEAVDGDLMSAHVFLFGKVIGNSISTLFIFYFSVNCITTLGSLIEVIRTWMFPSLNSFWFASVYLLLGIYIVNGGFRTVVGISFFGLLIPSYLLLSFIYPIKYGDVTNLLPIFDHTPMELIRSAYYMAPTFFGYGILMFFYPFIKKPQESKKWVHVGVLTSTFINTGLAIISFIYFPPGLLQRSIWPTLEMWKIVSLPFVERFEYLGIANWTLVIVSNVAIALWCASRIAKRVYKITQRKAVLIVAIMCLLFVLQVDTSERMKIIFHINTKIGIVAAYIYTPLIYLLMLIKQKVKAK